MIMISQLGLHTEKSARDLNVERAGCRPPGSSIHYGQRDTSPKLTNVTQQQKSKLGASLLSFNSEFSDYYTL